ncbi:MAG: family 10 glycosylhydrolase [Armatimonadetes bacterium]|nr:family 10 glycosylhydrolase [Armatimonadota bacterium]
MKICRISRTAVALACALVLALACSDARADEFRAFWVDAWGAGLLNQTQVEKLLGKVGDPNNKGVIRNTNCNAVIVQVRRRADVCYPSGMGEPYFSGLSPANYNALQAMINAAHDTTGGKKRIEVHCWIVTFATASGATASPVYYQHNNPADLDNYWVTLDNNGNETDDKAFDPGHPKCEQYIVDVCMDLVRNFDIDGLHYDYIRFTGGNQGYNPVSVARFNERFGRTGQPSPSDPQFSQWRRDQVTSVVRKVYANIQKYKPWVKQSASVVTWNPSPVASTRAAFMNTRPYYEVYSDWDSWLQEGILDFAVPMTYYNNASLPNDYIRWMNFEKDRKANRQMVIGPGIYLNSLSNAILQLQMTRNPSPAGNYADGFSGYSYRVPYNGGTWDNFSPSLVSQVTPTWEDLPAMPWKTNPTKGHLMGTATIQSTGDWADGATVTLTGPENRTMTCDGTGFYAFIDLAPGSYSVTCSKAGYPNQSAVVTVTAGLMSEQNFVLGGTPPPQISGVGVNSVTNTSATVQWTTDQAASSQVEYGITAAYGQSTSIDNTPVTSHSMALTGLLPSTTYHFRVKSTAPSGTSTSSDYTFTTYGPPGISDIQSAPSPTSAVITWKTAAPSDSIVKYGPGVSYGQQEQNGNLTLTHQITLSGLIPNQTYHYQALSANPYGAGASGDLTFTTPPIPVEYLVDNSDPGWQDTSPSGSWSVGASASVPKIGADYLYTSGSGTVPPASPTRSCTWRPNLPAAGLYDVYAYYQMGQNRNSSAPYTVHYDGGQVTSVQNQNSDTPNQGGWFLIGENLPFAAGTAGYVELTNLSADTRYVSADAVKWVLKSSDSTPPVMTSVSDETYTTSLTTLNAQWAGSDPESGILRFEYAVGSAAGLSDIKGWTDAGTDTSAAIAGLTLQQGHTYYVSVRAVNNQYLTSAVLSSPGVSVVSQLATIAQAKALDDGEAVSLTPKVVTAVFPGRFYIEDDSRASGIRVDSPVAISADRMAQVSGRLALIDGERRLVDCIVTPGSPTTPLRPLILRHSHLGGSAFNSKTPGVSDSVDLNNVGLMIRSVGQVKSVGADGFYFDDGSGLRDGSGATGVWVWTGTAPVQAPGAWVQVTGISSVRQTNAGVSPVILARFVLGL